MAKGYREVRRTLADGTVKTYRYATSTGARIESDPQSWSFKMDLMDEERHASRGPTVEALIARYRKSMDFRDLAPKSKVLYEGVMLHWLDAGANFYVKDLTRSQIAEMRDELLDTPGKAAQFVSFTKRLLNFAVDHDMIEANPAARLRKPRLGTIKRWPEAKIDPTIQSLPGYLALPCWIALYAGQRVSDIIGMDWSCYDGQTLVLSQQKTRQGENDERMVVPVHPRLKAILDAQEARVGPISTNSKGEPWVNRTSYTSVLRYHLDELGMEGYSIHGLRKSAASRMAEAGCSSKQIAAVLGHKTLAMVELYTREAEQKRLAQEAMKKLVDGSSFAA